MRCLVIQQLREATPGTAHIKRIMEAEGKTALLTGKNGSGKSTRVDGLLTLLVENSNRRNYNQAAGHYRG